MTTLSQRPTRPRRRRPLLVALAALAAVGAAVAVLPGRADTSVHPVPYGGQAEPVRLDEHTPALVVDVDGTVAAFDARSPHVEAGRRGLLGWCRSSGALIDPVSGHSWRADGRGRVTSGLRPRADRDVDEPPEPLRPLPAEVAGGSVRVTVPDGVETRRVAPATNAAPCSPDALVVPPLPGAPAAVAALAGDPSDGIYRVEGLLWQPAGERARLCPPQPEGDLPNVAACPPTRLPPSRAVPSGHVEQVAGTLAATVVDGEVVEVMWAHNVSRGYRRAP